MRTLQRFATVCFIGAAFAALISACGSTDASPPAPSAGAPGAAGAPAGGAGAPAAGAPAGGGGSVLVGNAANGKTLYSTTSVGCNGCHGQDDKAGEGDAGPNITGSKAAGIGNWTEAQFKDAVREAKDKTGAKLYLMPPLDASMVTDQGIADIYAFLMSKSVDTANAGSYCTAVPGTCKGTH